MTSAAPDKQTLRKNALAARAMMAHAAGELAAKRLAANGLELIASLQGDVISGYVPVRHEISVTPLMEALALLGRTLALPVIDKADAPLIFRRHRPGEALIPGAFGIPVPPEDAPVTNPAILIVPLAAFDAAGNRLGYGGGYYDRTLAALRARPGGPVTAIGAAFSGQQLDAIPARATDQPLDWIITDRGVIRAAA